MNIGCFREAAEHFLGALSLHVVDNGTEVQTHVSKTLWDTLKRNFVLMERRDLADKATKDQNVESFRGDFEF
jgi:peroxin-5